MSHSASRKTVLIGLACVFFIGLVIVVLNANSYTRERSSYIEVGGGKIAYVPRTATFVKINGQVRRIVKFLPLTSLAAQDCQCPKCCNGLCYIIVSSDAPLIAGLVIIQSVILVSCT